MNRHGHGHISSDGLVMCGECVADHAVDVALGRASRESYNDAAYEPFEAGEGDDWCSVCDADLVPRHGGQRFRA
jgi:hypothetical protein